MAGEPQRWMEKAREDAETADYNLRGGRLGAATFFAQQAAEKALKAVYIQKHLRLVKIHDLVQLAKSVGAPPEVLQACDELRPYYAMGRYPDIPGPIEPDDARRAIERAREVQRWAAGRL